MCSRSGTVHVIPRAGPPGSLPSRVHPAGAHMLRLSPDLLLHSLSTLSLDMPLKALFFPRLQRRTVLDTIDT